MERRYSIDDIAYKMMGRMHGYMHSLDIVILIGVLCRMRQINKLSVKNLESWIRDTNEIYGFMGGPMEYDCKEVVRQINDKEFVNYVVPVIEAMPDSELANFFEKTLSLFMSEVGRGIGTYSMPTELIKLVEYLLTGRNLLSIYNPFSGFSSFSLMAGIGYYCGEDINPSVAIVGQLRMNLNGLSGTVHIKDSLESLYTCKEGSYDALVAYPPLGLRLPAESPYGQRYRNVDALVIDKAIECVNLNGAAIIIVPNSFLFAHNGDRMVVKQHIINDNLVDTIISLPPILPLTNALASIVVLRKGKTNQSVRIVDASSMILGTKQINRSLDIDRLLLALSLNDKEYVYNVNITDIVRNDYSLTPETYRPSEDVPENHIWISFEECTSRIRGERHYDAENGRCISIGDLSSDPLNYIKDVSSFEEVTIKSQYYKVTETVLLLSKVRDLKVTLVNASEEMPIYVSPYILAYKFESSIVDISYFVYKVSQAKTFSMGAFIPSINNQVIEGIRISVPPLEEQISTMQSIVRENALSKARELGLETVIQQMKAEYMAEVESRGHDMRAPLRQLRSTNSNISYLFTNCESDPDYRNNMAVQLRKQKEAIAMLTQLVDVFSRENKFGTPEKLNIDRTLRKYVGEHTVNNKSYRVFVEYDFAALLRCAILNPKLVEHNDLDVDTTVLDEFIEGWLGHDMSTIELYPVDYKWRYNETSEADNKYSDDDLQKEKAVVDSILRDNNLPNCPLCFASNNFEAYDSMEVEMQAFCSQKLAFFDIYAEIASDDFVRLVQNIIENAVMHSFDNNCREESICIRISADAYTGCYVIDFSNSGKPFPEGLTKEQYGTRGYRAGASGNTGNGGYVIKSVSQHYGGDYDIISIGGMPTVRVYLPFIRFDEING